MKLKINDSYHISDITLSDKFAYLEHLKEKQIYDQTLAIPYPYTEEDADWWINHNIEAVKAQDGRSVNWAIRRSEDDYLIGGIGFLGMKIGEDHKAELGYWLAKPYWNKGLMTEAVKVASQYGFKELGLTRIIDSCSNQLLKITQPSSATSFPTMNYMPSCPTSPLRWKSSAKGVPAGRGGNRLMAKNSG